MILRRAIQTPLLSLFLICSLLLVSLSAWSTDGLSPGQRAALVLLLSGSSMTEESFEVLEFDLNPGSDGLISGRTNEGREISVTGDKTATGDVARITGLTIAGSMPGEDSSVVFDEFGRITRVVLEDSEILLEYLSISQARMTVFTEEGQFSEVIDIPAVATMATTANRDLGACLLDDLFQSEVKEGEVVFVCDVPYDFLVPSGKLYPQGILDVRQRDIAALPVQFELAFDGQEPVINQNTFVYRMEIPTQVPTFEDYKACSRRVLGGVTRFAWDAAAELVGVLTAKFTQYALEGRRVGSSGVGLRLLKDLASDSFGALGAVAADTYIDDEFGLNPADYVNADLYIRRKPSRDYENGRDLLLSPSLIYSQRGLDVQSGDSLPTLVAGPAPPELDQRFPVLAFKQLSDGSDELVDDASSDSDDSAVYHLDPGDTVLMRAFDQFFNRSMQASILTSIETQRYDCAEYRWSVLKDGVAYQGITGIAQGENDNGLLLENLPAGVYEVTIRVNNNGLDGGFTMDANWSPTPVDIGAAINLQEYPLNPLPTDSETVTLIVGSDDDAIRDYLVGTWDIYHDGAYRVGGRFEDNTFGICPEQIPNVEISNYFYPEPFRANLNQSSKPSHRLELNDDGTGVFTFYNIDSSVENAAETCPVILGSSQDIRWSVINGVVTWASRRGHLTVERIREKGRGGSFMETNDWDFATGTSNGDVVDRYRWQRVAN